METSPTTTLQSPRLGEADRRNSLSAGCAVAAAFIGTCSLVLPWFEVSGRSRSSIDLIASANALDLLVGSTRIIVIVLWLAVPVISAAALLSFAARRFRLAAALVLPFVASILLVFIIGLVVDLVGLAWGAWVAAASAVVALACAMMVLVRRQGAST